MAGRAFVVLLVLAMTAGCLGGRSPTSPTTVLGVDAPAAGQATVAGRVESFAGLPLADAVITLLPVGLETSSDARGAFAFPDVPAGAYDVTAQRFGYEAGKVALEAEADTVHHVTFTMRSLALAMGAPPQSSSFDGFVQCSANAYYPSNVCGRPLGEAKDHLQVTADEKLPLAGLLFELVWTPASPATGQELELDVCLPRSADAPLNCRDLAASAFHAYGTGTSPVVVRIPAADLPEGERTFDVWIGSGYLSPYPTLAQSFTLHTTFCYVAACPDDYTALS